MKQDQQAADQVASSCNINDAGGFFVYLQVADAQDIQRHKNIRRRWEKRQRSEKSARLANDTRKAI